MMAHLISLDRWLAAADRALRTVAAAAPAVRAAPPTDEPALELSPADRRHSIGLMRVNHVGEICAQALYDAQALAANSSSLREMFQRAAEEEGDHLAWTRERIEQLGGRVSLLNPLWYAGSFAIGLAAARAGDALSLGFMAETERQVEQHLADHLERLPAADSASRAIVEQMKEDEAKHAADAVEQGGSELPLPIRLAMRLASRVMTRSAYYV